jgi:hypothetical protein
MTGMTVAEAGPPLPLQLMTTRARRFLGAVTVVEGMLALSALLSSYGLAERLVAAQEQEGERLATVDVHWWGPDFSVTLAMSLLLVGAASGVVGSVIQQSIVFASRVGQDTLEQGLFWWYVLRPVWSALLGSVVVVAVNTGLISIGDTTTSSAGVTVLVTMGALAGMYTDQALQRLQPFLGTVPGSQLQSHSALPPT